LLPVNQVVEFPVALDKPGDIRTAGNDLPTLLPRLVQRGSDQSSGQPTSAKSVWDKSVVENDAVALVDVAEERNLFVACLHLKALETDVVRDVEWCGCHYFHSIAVMILQVVSHS
jgi:hypothetical protein